MFLPEPGYTSVGGMRVKRRDQFGGFGQPVMFGMDEQEDYLPPVEMGGGAPPPPPPQPTQPPPRRALDELAAINSQRPSSMDPAYKPKPLERVLGGLAGAAVGFGEGYVNSGKYGPRVRPGGGAALADAIVNRRFNNANTEWKDKAAKAQDAAKIEAEQVKNQRDESYNEARIGSANATQEYRRKQTESLNQPKPVTPIQHDPTKNLVVPDGQGGFKTIIEGKAKPANTPATIEARINAIRMNPDFTPEQQDNEVETAVRDYNTLHPKAPIVRIVNDDSGTVRVVYADAATKTSTVEDKGRIGKTKSEPVAAGNAERKQFITSEANRLLAENGGDYDKAIAAAADVDVKQRLASLRNTDKGSPSSKGKGDLKSRIGKMFGGTGASTPSAPAAPAKKADPLGIR